MDKMKLSQEQLKELRYFIYKRGFREPEVMMEILDHFACKVEDKLSAKPGMSLEEAMKEAHNEFGYNGFYSIKASLDVFTRRRYVIEYRKALKKMVVKPLRLIGLLAIGVGSYFAIHWAYINNMYDSYFEYNIVSMILLLTMVFVEVSKAIILYPKRNSKSYYLDIANTINYTGFFTIWICFPLSVVKSEKQLMIYSIWGALIIVYFVLSTVAHYKMMSKAYKDYEDFKAMVPSENPLA